MPIEVEIFPTDPEGFRQQVLDSGKCYIVVYKNGILYGNKIRGEKEPIKAFNDNVKTQIKTDKLKGDVVKISKLDGNIEVKAFANLMEIDNKGSQLEKMLFSKDFYFSKAQDILSKLDNYKINPEKIQSILDIIGIGKNTTKNDILKANVDDNEKSKLLEIVNKLIALSDSKASDKKKLNPYKDHRTITSGKTQDSWTRDLLKYKLSGEVTEHVGNLISFIKEPNKYSSICNNEHRQKISKCFLDKDYQKKIFLNHLKNKFNFGTKIKVSNPKNENIVLTKIFYSDNLKKEWNGKDNVMPIIDEIMSKKELEDKMKTPLNQILYGPPGTGKTYSTVAHTLKILGDEENNITSIKKLKEKYPSQVEFVTFHQSFSYEDFVEGLKAESTDGKLSYDVEDGIFKDICVSAKPWSLSSYNRVIEKIKKQLVNGKFLKFETLQNKRKFKVTCENNKILGTPLEDNTKNESREFSSKSLKMFWLNEDEQEEDKENDIDNKSYILPFVKYIDKNFKNDFQNTPHILIIDEINRGNISRIFGELITLIEPTKRAGEDEALEVTLPYSKVPFSVPKNLYIIGTMNTADRSLALMDTALRRRFDFVEMMPNPCLLHIKGKKFIEEVKKYHCTIDEWENIDRWSLDGSDKHWIFNENYEDQDLLISDDKNEDEDEEEINLRRLLFAINERIEVLYDREHTIGHSFLMQVTSLKGLKEAFKNKILPLLEEYFYDDWGKISLVLADKENNFYTAEEPRKGLFVDIKNVDYDTNKKVYRRNFINDIENKAFINIYKKPSKDSEEE